MSTLTEEPWDNRVRRQWRALRKPLVSALSTSSLLVQGLPPVRNFLSNEFQIFSVFVKDFHAFFFCQI